MGESNSRILPFSADLREVLCALCLPLVTSVPPPWGGGRGLQDQVGRDAHCSE